METRNSPFSNNEDRISKLPDTLIHHILSFLDMKYAVQASVLSRTWRYIWISLPILNFNSTLFKSPNTRRSDGFIDFVDKVLFRRDGSDIQRFHLVWNDSNSGIVTCHLNIWILAAIRHNVQELCVDIGAKLIIQFPRCLFTCKSLTKLELLMGGKEPSKIILPNSMGLPRLKSLKLGTISIDDEKLVNKLISSCPVLESLFVLGSYMNLNISSLKLKHFELNASNEFFPSDMVIKLNAPNLTSFTCKDYFYEDHYLENLSSLVTADICMKLREIFKEDVAEEPQKYTDLPSEGKEVCSKRMLKLLRALHNVKELRLSHWFVEVVSGAPKLLDSQPPLCNLRCLKLATLLSRSSMHAITFLLKISPNIESLFLSTYPKWSTEAEMYPYCDEIKFGSGNIGDYWEAGLLCPYLLHHLKFVEIRGIQGCVHELKFLEILLKNALVLEKVVLFSSKDDLPNRERRLMIFSEKLLTFPRASLRTIAFLFF